MALTSRANVVIHVVGCDEPPQPTQIARDDNVTMTAPGVAVPSVLSNDDYFAPWKLYAATPVPPELYFNEETGEVTLRPGAAYGTYVFRYWLCRRKRQVVGSGEVSVPDESYCSLATVRVRYIEPTGGRCYRVARGVYDPC